MRRAHQIAQVLPNLRHDKGVVVGSVSPEAPFSQQGRIQAGDVIYALNSRPVGRSM